MPIENAKLLEVTDKLNATQPKIERNGYPISCWNDWHSIVLEWGECHPSWSAQDLYLGIKYFGHQFPHNVSIDMVNNTNKWES